ncbi:hypothetical protein PVAP13_3KG472401 [Panicum virgatum]|uniref:Uncharacterized protein n=1 Tax=Panicum virgatum TaxID=38727 RepID=A0A8T0VAZ5_PANVG|nr:hypothetical protein PVAP13_3KG472401 [Panicum virgatum]
MAPGRRPACPPPPPPPPRSPAPPELQAVGSGRPRSSPRLGGARARRSPATQEKGERDREVVAVVAPPLPAEEAAQGRGKEAGRARRGGRTAEAASPQGATAPEARRAAAGCLREGHRRGFDRAGREAMPGILPRRRPQRATASSALVPRGHPHLTVCEGDEGGSVGVGEEGPRRGRRRRGGRPEEGAPPSLGEKEGRREEGRARELFIANGLPPPV